jgi:hypothetical protein
MDGIAVFMPLWFDLNYLGGVVDIPESSEVGDRGWNGSVVFIPTHIAI